MIEGVLGLLAVAIWAYLLTARGGFWRADQTDGRGQSRIALDRRSCFLPACAFIYS